MKNTVNTNVKKQKIKKKPIKVKTMNKKEQVLIVAQEIKFARLLSGNEKTTRDRVLKSLKKWLLSCFAKNYEFKEDDFVRVWKGLFYAVWMSDKPLIQEELCESIAGILDVFPPEQLRGALLMARAGFRVLATEWYGIDHHRMDKFLMLVRRYLRGSLRCLKRDGWSLEGAEMYADMIGSKDGILSTSTPLYARNATSMILHVVDCFLEELNKLCKGALPGPTLAALLRPFSAYLCGGQAAAVAVACRRLLTSLIRNSEQGVAYQDRQRAWQTMGCPEGGPDVLELVASDDGDDDEQADGDDGDQSDDDAPLDPRAGRVDVTLHAWRAPAALLAAQLRALLPRAQAPAQRRARICMQRFEQLARDQYPLPVPSSLSDHARERKTKSHPIRSLRSLDTKLTSDADELALRGLSRKHRKRLLAKSRAGLDIVEEAKALHSTSNGMWQVEDTEPIEKISEGKDTSNKENDKKKTNTNNNKENKKKSQQTTDKKVKVDANKNQKESMKRKHYDGKPEKNIKKQKLQAKTEEKPQKLQESNQKSNEKTKKFVHKVSYQKQTASKPKSPNKDVEKKNFLNTPKKVKFVLKNNSMQQPLDYYKSVRQSPNIPFDSSRAPSKTNLKVSTPSPINPFFRKKLRLKK